MGKFDEAYEFIHEVQPLETEQSDLKHIYAKVDKRILPLLAGVYLLQFLDKSLLNFSAALNIKDVLDNPGQFSDLGTILYVGYIIFEPIMVIAFQKLPFAKFFAATIIVWGILVTLHACCKSYSSLMAIRFFLGASEASAAIGISMCNGMWYSHKQQLGRIAIITSQVGAATIIGGLLSFAFQYVNHQNAALYSWQILFLLIGLITFIFGLVVLKVLPDNLMRCHFLTDQEKLLLLDHLKYNQTGIENKTFKLSHLKECLRDKKTWILSVLTVVTMIPTGAINTFSITIITSLGFDSKKSTLMQMPVGLSSIIAILVPMYTVSYFNDRFRTVVFIGLLMIGIVGYFMLIFCHNKYANLFAVYFANAGTCVITLLYSWNTRNTAGYTKRLVRHSLTMICIALGSLIGPQLFKSDIPRYLNAKIALLVLSFVGIPLVLLLAYVSKQENIKRDNLSEKEIDDFNESHGKFEYEFKDLTDIENIHFRYGY